MASTAAGKAGLDDTGAESGNAKSVPDLEAEIAQLKADIEKLAEQVARTGEMGFGTARRAAAMGADQIRAQGEAALEGLRANAKDMEDQLMAHVQEKPITSLAIAAGVGFLFAILSRR